MTHDANDALPGSPTRTRTIASYLRCVICVMGACDLHERAGHPMTAETPGAVMSGAMTFAAEIASSARSSARRVIGSTEAEAGPCVLGRESERVEDLGLDLGPVDADRAATDLEPVHDHVVGARAPRARIGGV